MNKRLVITGASMIAVVALSLASNHMVSSIAATELSSRVAKEQIIFISKAEIERVTGNILTADTVVAVAERLSDANTWMQLGFSGEEAGKIAGRAQQFLTQLQETLRTVSANLDLQLKVVLPADGSVFIGQGTREGHIFDEPGEDYDGGPIE